MRKGGCLSKLAVLLAVVLAPTGVSLKAQSWIGSGQEMAPTTDPDPLGLGYSTLESAMNIEPDEVVVQGVSDDALEHGIGGAQGNDESQ